jgi:hypothetical protein
MIDELKERIREHGRRDRRDAFFGERLLELLDQIERRFAGAERDRLLALAHRTFERHLELRDCTLRTRERLARLAEEQRMLGELCMLLTPRRGGDRLH